MKKAIEKFNKTVTELDKETNYNTAIDKAIEISIGDRVMHISHPAILTLIKDIGGEEFKENMNTALRVMVYNAIRLYSASMHRWEIEPLLREDSKEEDESGTYDSLKPQELN